MRTVVAQVFVKKDDKILMVQENKDSVKGKWDMPAGKLEDGETIIETAIRETKEETNLDVEIKGLIAVHQITSSYGQLLILYFLGEYVSGEIKFDSKEISDVKYMSLDEIKALPKEQIRGAETIFDIIELANNPISLDRVKIENLLK